ncbi:MAG TPA: hypothetical protein VMX17_02480 [Candidatus Glassbacteria bacterium]|nr:hypothetical protein [Candidatus Glassbacteria bacterium]
MSDFVFRTKKQYWSAIKNMTSHVNNNTAEGIATRKQWYNLTGNEYYLEKNFQKSDLKITKSQVRKDFGKIKKDSTDKLKIAWKEEKDKGNKITWKKYSSDNSQPDYETIKESYNSPE